MRAEPVRGDRCEITGIGFMRVVTMLRADKRGWLPRRPPVLSGRIAVGPVVLLGVNSYGCGGMRRGSVPRVFAALLRRWLVFRCPGGADEPDQEFIRADDADRWQAATTAPTGPCDQPWAMFAVRVAAMPATASTATAVDRRMTRSMLPATVP